MKKSSFLNRYLILWIFLIILLVFTGCAAKNSQDSLVSKANIGNKIAVEGQAVDSKMGALLIGDNFKLWIDNLSEWPKGYFLGGNKGIKVKVTGILEEAHDLPVFIPKENEPIVQGIPVPEGTDLKEASSRFLLKNAEWEPIEE